MNKQLKELLDKSKELRELIADVTEQIDNKILDSNVIEAEILVNDRMEDAFVALLKMNTKVATLISIKNKQ